MQTGTKISGVAHITLIGVAVFGGAFRSDPLPFEVHEVSVISSAQFAALTATKVPPVVSEEPAALPVPDTTAEPPDISAQPDADPEQVQPEQSENPAPDPVPDALPDPAPEADASDTAPVLVSPVPEAVVVPQQPTPQPAPRPVERIAPQPVAAPPPDVKPDDVATPEVSAETGAEAPRDPQEATAPEEATDQIVTEADQSASLAPTTSLRPPARRPARPTAPPEPAADTGQAVNAALAEALGGSSPTATPSATASTPAPSGPPLTAGEKDSLRVAVQGCWNVGSLSSEALLTTVVVGVSMTREGKPDINSIRLLSSSGGSAGSAERAFGAARRAIIRCGKNGYDLPADKYGQWRDIEMTFNPERMRIK